MANMRKRSKKSVTRVNTELEDTELEMLRGSTIDWEALRPQIEDIETYDKLIAEVNAATAANESLAALKTRMVKLGAAGAAVFKKVIALAT